MYFKSSLDKLTIVITSLVFLMFLSMTIGPFIGWFNAKTPMLIVTSFLWLIFMFCYLIKVKGYKVTPSKIIIDRLFLKKDLPIDSISEVRLLDKKETRYTLRIMGVGGVFGYYGEMWSAKLGNSTWYSTKYSSLVLIRVKKKKYVVSPDDREKFVAQVSSYSKSA